MPLVNTFGTRFKNVAGDPTECRRSEVVIPAGSRLAFLRIARGHERYFLCGELVVVVMCRVESKKRNDRKSRVVAC